MRLISKFSKVGSSIIFLPCSKSYLNRALIIASCCTGKTELLNAQHLPDDVLLMLKCLEKIGIDLEFVNDKLIIVGVGTKFKIPTDGILNCGIAGTTSRFIVGLSVLFDFDVKISAEGKMLGRPMNDLIDSMVDIGVPVEYLGNVGCLPIKVHGKKEIKSKSVTIDGSKSSQFLTSLLMVSPFLSLEKITVKSELVSKSYIDITLAIMKDFGAEIKNDNYQNFQINHKNYISKSYKIESDWSSASYFIAAAVFSNSYLDLYGLNLNSVQGDTKFLTIVESLGVKVERNSDFIRVFACDKLKSILEIDMSTMPDTAMTMAVLLAFANGDSKISGLSTLKDKECNRLQAMHDEFSKIGIKTEIGDDFIVVHGNPNLKIENPVEIETYHDHRIAMMFAILGMKTGNILIKNPSVVSKSFANFWELFDSIYG